MRINRSTTGNTKNAHVRADFVTVVPVVPSEDLPQRPLLRSVG